MAEWLKAPVLKTGGPKGSGGSNPSPTASFVETCLSGLRCLPAKEMGPIKAPWVQIPPSLPVLEVLANGKPPVSKTGAPERGLRVQVSSTSAIFWRFG